MRRDRDGGGRMTGGGYGRDFGRRGPYNAGYRRGYDAGWREEMAYGRLPGPAVGPGTFSPFGWDPMMRWSGWDPLMGYVPYQDTPREWSYGLAEDDRRYDHPYYRGNTTGGYGGDYRRAAAYEADYRLPPRRSPTYGRGGDEALREWARRRGYDVEYTIHPRHGRRR